MRKVLNIAHRGFRKSFPDNTLEAFDAAIQLKVDGIECDVQETADHQFVIFHDDEIEGNSINEMTLTEIREVRLAEHFRIPTLAETLDLCRHKTRLDIELKLVYSLQDCLQIVRARTPAEELMITSFYGALISGLADLAPEIQRGILTNFPVEDPVRLVESTGAQMMLPRFSFATDELVTRLHAHNHAIIVWDCNQPDDLHTALSWGVDGIITDAPDLLNREIQSRNE